MLSHLLKSTNREKDYRGQSGKIKIERKTGDGLLLSDGERIVNDEQKSENGYR